MLAKPPIKVGGHLGSRLFPIAGNPSGWRSFVLQPSWLAFGSFPLDVAGAAGNLVGWLSLGWQPSQLALDDLGWIV